MATIVWYSRDKTVVQGVALQAAIAAEKLFFVIVNFQCMKLPSVYQKIISEFKLPDTINKNFNRIIFMSSFKQLGKN